MPFVRIIDQEQRKQMLELLAEAFPHSDIDWSAAFEAPSGDTGHGLLLIVDGRVQGGILSFEKMEAIGGRRRRIVNLSSWYIRPPYRRLAVRMLREVTADPDTVYMACSPIRSAQKIGLRIGFRYLSHGSIASVPLINGAISRGVSSIESFVTGTLSNPDHDRWMADHGEERHIGVLVRSGASTVPVLWLRGLKLHGLSAARLLFTTDYGVLGAALPAVHWYMLKRHGIGGLYLPRIGPLALLRSVRRHHSGPSLMVKGGVDPEDINLLYSELLYLHARK
jgi:hypothetical protein